MRSLFADPRVDYFIGSVHHVHGIPIDYSTKMYLDAVQKSTRKTEESLWEDYYDLHHRMLTALKPKVVGHFDLIRLMSETPGHDPRTWKGVWERALRNLHLVNEQDGWLECNTAALRKGLDEPYPARALAEEWVKMGGKFTMSDDSHGIAQVATNYARGLAYLESLGVTELWTLRRKTHPGITDGVRGEVDEVAVPIAAFREIFSA